jgi:hypothetical protein
MAVEHDAPAVAIARAHVDAWSNHDYDTAREGLAPDIRLTLAGTQPVPRTVELTGVDDYMKGLIAGTKHVLPGSLRVIAGLGDERNALLMLTYEVDYGAGVDYGERAWKGKWTLPVARLYLLDDNNKITIEHVVYYMAPQ